VRFCIVPLLLAALLSSLIAAISMSCWTIRIYAGTTIVRVERSGIKAVWKEYRMYQTPVLDVDLVDGVTGGWWASPSLSYLDSSNLSVDIDGNRQRVSFPTPKTLWLNLPHWLTNLVSWSLFIILWRKSRKHPAGHCQSCGYDLTGNESGACPECNATVEVTA